MHSMTYCLAKRLAHRLYVDKHDVDTTLYLQRPIFFQCGKSGLLHRNGKALLVECTTSRLSDKQRCLQYNLPFYLQYLASWPEYCLTAEGPGRQVMGYILGKSEGEGFNWHGHVTAVTVAPEYRLTPQKCLTASKHGFIPATPSSLPLASSRVSACYRRRQRLAKKLMDDLETITEKVHKAYFVDLFVRVSNASAIRMYNKVCTRIISWQLSNRSDVGASVLSDLSAFLLSFMLSEGSADLKNVHLSCRKNLKKKSDSPCAICTTCDCCAHNEQEPWGAAVWLQRIQNGVRVLQR